MISRALPHSTEAEEGLLSCCFVDGSAVLGQCLIAKVEPQDFYIAANGVVYQHMLELFHRGDPIDTAVVGVALQESKKLEAIGGWAYLLQVSRSSATTAQASYFISKVKEFARRRSAIRAHTAAAERLYSHGGEDDLAEQFNDIRSQLDKIEVGEDLSVIVRDAGEFKLPPENDPRALIGRHRYISRGDACTVVSSSGMGKSVMNYEWAVLAALGRPFLGLETRMPLRSLIVQSEDSDGDIGEILFSVYESLQLTPAQRQQVSERVKIVSLKGGPRGAAFCVRLRQLVTKFKPDLVWINPLHAFAGCEITDATQLGEFLRVGLDGVNRENNFAYMIIHHTPKPVSAKAVPEKKWHEFMYEAAGSAELVNYCRAVITLKPTPTEGEFNLILAKRGRRAGVVMEIDTESGERRLEVVTKIPCKHSSRKIIVEGRKEPFLLMHWEARDPDKEPAVEGKNKGGRTVKYRDEDFIIHFPASIGDPMTGRAIERKTAEDVKISHATFYDRRNRLLARELVQQTQDGRWKRTEMGDSLARSVGQKRVAPTIPL